MCEGLRKCNSSLSWYEVGLNTCDINQKCIEIVPSLLGYLLSMVRAKEAGVEVAEKKEMINTLSKFQMGLEKIDSYHHGQLPPLYRQVSCPTTFLINLYFSFFRL